MFVVTYRRLLLAIGFGLMVISVGVIGWLGLNLGVDFAGGAITEVTYSEDLERVALEERLDKLSLEPALGAFSLRQTRGDGGQPGYILRTRDLTDEERVIVSAELTSIGQDGEIVRFTSVGPIIGTELREKATWAIGGIVLLITLYLAFAFRGLVYPVKSWAYGLITVAALIHDTLIPVAFMSFLGYVAGLEVDVLFVMAMLAVLGYSVNDTIVVFDRVRENLLHHRLEHKKQSNVGGLKVETVEYELTKPFTEIVGLSVKQSVLRSVNTSLTTLFALGALYFVGGSVTQTFALILMVGVVAGSYSSIFFASPLLLWFAERTNKQAVSMAD